MNVNKRLIMTNIHCFEYIRFHKIDFYKVSFRNSQKRPFLKQLWHKNIEKKIQPQKVYT